MKLLLNLLMKLFKKTPPDLEPVKVPEPEVSVVPTPAPPVEAPEPMKPKFKLSQTSLKRLATVKEPLQRVVKRAIEISEVDFGVGQALRTYDEQARLYGQGRTRAQMAAAGLNPDYAKPNMPKVTWTMNSNHLSGNAVDLVPYVNGKVEWDNDGKLGLWPKIAEAMKTAAEELGVKIEWGGDWKKTVDRPHFELV